MCNFEEPWDTRFFIILVYEGHDQMWKSFYNSWGILFGWLIYIFCEKTILLMLTFETNISNFETLHLIMIWIKSEINIFTTRVYVLDF